MQTKISKCGNNQTWKNLKRDFTNWCTFVRPARLHACADILTCSTAVGQASRFFRFLWRSSAPYFDRSMCQGKIAMKTTACNSHKKSTNFTYLCFCTKYHDGRLEFSQTVVNPGRCQHLPGGARIRRSDHLGQT